MGDVYQRKCIQLFNYIFLTNIKYCIVGKFTHTCLCPINYESVPREQDFSLLFVFGKVTCRKRIPNLNFVIKDKIDKIKKIECPYAGTYCFHDQDSIG